MNRGFDLLVLNDKFEIISILSYTVLQWSRKFWESGTFSVEIPIETYSSDFKYLYTNERPELGVIEQINFYIQDDFKSVNLSGYFLEEQVNKRVAYQMMSSTNILNSPDWAIQKDKAEDVAYTFFDDFKDVIFTQNGQTLVANLGIESGVSLGRGHESEHTRGNEQLGDKIYTILKPSLMSYRVRYDFNSSRKVFEVWKGKDRTQNNEELNNPVVFSTKNGTISKADLLISTSNMKNCYMVSQGDESTEGDTYLIAGREGDGTDDRFLYLASSSNISDYDSLDAYVEALRAEGHEEVLKNAKIVSLDFDTLEGAYQYLEDFDLGDVCSIEVPELELSEDAVLSGIYEVIKKGVWSMTLEFTTI